MKNLSTIIVTLLTLTLFAACERSVGYDPTVDAGTNNNLNNNQPDAEVPQPDSWVPEPSTLTYEVDHSVYPVRLWEPLDPITQFDLINDSYADISVSSITFKLHGSILPSEVLELWLYHELPFEFHSDTYTWDNDFVTFDLSASPIYVERGNMQTFTLRVMVDADPCIDTIGFDIERDSDIYAVDMVYGLDANIVEGIYSESASPVPVHGESIAFALAPGNPPAGDVFVGTDDHEFIRFNVTSMLDVQVLWNSVTINLPDPASANYFSDVKFWMKNVYGDWVVVSGPLELSPVMCQQDGTCSIGMVGNYDMAACETYEFKVTMDVSSGTAPLGITPSIDIPSYAFGFLDVYNDPVQVDAVNISGGILEGNPQEVIF